MPRARRNNCESSTSSPHGASSILWMNIAPSEDPHSIGKALKGPLGDLWRYRVGDFRIFCDIQDGVLTVLVLQIGNRREVYR